MKDPMGDTRKTLDLKVTVASTEEPDAVLAAILDTRPKDRTNLMQLKYSTRLPLDVIKVERADGQPIGLEGEFETYWAELYDGHYGEEDSRKEIARDAFMYGIKYARNRVKP